MANRKVHPFDLLKKKKKRKEYRKIQKKKQEIRKKNLRNLTPEKLLANIKKINHLVQEKKITINKRNKKKLKDYKEAYQDNLDDVLDKKKCVRSFYVNGIEKILGKTNKNITEPSQFVRENKVKKIYKKAVDPEFPPGFSLPLHIHFPPGIYPRNESKSIEKLNRNLIYIKDNHKKNTSNIPKVEILSNDSDENYDFNKNKNSFFDPINPINPLFMHHPKLQHSLELKLDKHKSLEVKKIKQQNLQLTFIGPTDVTQIEKQPVNKDSASKLLRIKKTILLSNEMFNLKPRTLSGNVGIKNQI